MKFSAVFILIAFAICIEGGSIKPLERPERPLEKPDKPIVPPLKPAVSRPRPEVIQKIEDFPPYRPRPEADVPPYRPRPEAAVPPYRSRPIENSPVPI
ncbi:unnamed protein product [Chironomus riparius]|uniref:Uncharacterized protein n=1 Tax=Chironomus riparius TaxID=315576 RepID=A0A9N9RYN3_9DIPT|nr:unnamed protein product [Chironomus riparius]